MKKHFLRRLSALLAAALLLTCGALAEGPAGTSLLPEYEYDSEEIDAAPVDDVPEETESDLDDGQTPEVLLDETEYELGDEDGTLFEFEDDAPEVYECEDAPLADSDALFSGYVQRLFGMGGALYEARNLGGDLTGEKRALYNWLKGCVAEVAAGTRASTVFDYSCTGALSKEDCDDVLFRLFADDPYEMYWFGNYWDYLLDGTTLTISLSVSGKYSAGGEYCFNTALASQARKAAANARAVVAQYAALSDYDKLVAYRDYICDAVSYNHEATYETWPEDEANPWELIWVFDDDPSTKVVCEGYAKAFQYLCDMSDFSGSVMCYCVTGLGNGGPHKWNIVRMPNGRNYLADITFCDQENTDTYDWVFMKAPVSGNMSQGYRFDVVNGFSRLSPTYQYDEETLAIYTDADLTLSAGSYLDESNLAPEAPNDPDPTLPETPNDPDPTPIETPDDPDPTPIETPADPDPTPIETPADPVSTPIETPADPVSESVTEYIPEFIPQTLPFDLPVSVTTVVSSTPSIPVYGNTRATLTAAPGAVFKLDPVGATGKGFKSSNKKVATVDVNGNITLKKAGKTKITFKAGKKKRTVTLKVVDPTIPKIVALSQSGTVAVKAGETTTLTATLPAGTSSGIKWKSSNKKVAAVDQNGNVTFKKKGKATITATATRGKKKAKVKFKVSK